MKTSHSLGVVCYCRSCQGNDWSNVGNYGRVTDCASFRRVQDEIIAAGTDSGKLTYALSRLCEGMQPLNFVNIATILHRTGKARLKLPQEITKYLTSALHGVGHSEKVNIVVYFPRGECPGHAGRLNVRGLVLGCIDAEVCN